MHAVQAQTQTNPESDFSQAAISNHVHTSWQVSRSLQYAIAGFALLLGGCAGSTKPSTLQRSQDTVMKDQGSSTPNSRTIAAAVYPLDGGSEVVVVQPFGKSNYGAVVRMDGEYPGAGKIAVDKGRSEFLYVLDGAFTVKVNQELFTLKAGENLLIHDGDSYYIWGKGRCMVMVQDQPGGKTDIQPSK